MPHDHVQKITFFTPSTLKSQTLGHAWPRGPNENPILYVKFTSFICEKTPRFSLKIFEIDFVIEI